MSGKANNKRLQKIGMILTLGMLLWIPGYGQVMKTITAGEGELFLLPEIGGIIVVSDDGPKIEMVLPVGQRPEKYNSVDLQPGDLIKMFNGKSMDSPALIEKTYKALATGDKIELGIKRGKDMMICSMEKMDEKDMPKGVSVRKCPAEAGDLSMDLIDIGIVLEKKDGHVLVADIFPDVTVDYQTGEIKAGDEIIKIQGIKVSSTDELAKLYQEIKSGEKMGISILRGKEEIKVEFTKPEIKSKEPVKMLKVQGK